MDTSIYYGFIIPTILCVHQIGVTSKLTIALKKYKNLIINKKKVYRLCKELDILRSQRIIKPKHPKKTARNKTVTGSNQLWQLNIKYGCIVGEDRFFFVLSYIDVFDRSIVYYHMGFPVLLMMPLTH